MEKVEAMTLMELFNRMAEVISDVGFDTEDDEPIPALEKEKEDFELECIRKTYRRKLFERLGVDPSSDSTE